MARVVDTLTGWARRTSWSAFAELRSSGFVDTQLCDLRSEPIYRLRTWPFLQPTMRTADVLRLLSLMSNRPVNRSWMLKHSPLGAARVDSLLDLLLGQDALETIDPSHFPADVSGREPRVS